MPLNRQRRNSIWHIIGDGMLVSREWLLAQKPLKLTGHAIDNLLKSKELYTVFKGIYCKGGTNPTWQTVIYSLQHYFNIDVVPGGLTALELVGYGHYVAFSREPIIHVYSSQKLPRWINEAADDATFITHSTIEITGRGNQPAGSSFFEKFNAQYGIPHYNNNYIIQISGPERAMLEAIAGIPKYSSPEYIYQLMQGLTSLSPEKMQTLLENCHSVKVRRLFFWLADKLNYPWLKKINRSAIDLGSGNRVIIKGGTFDKKYRITVPDNL